MRIKKKATSTLLVVAAILAAWFALPRQVPVTDSSGDVDTFVRDVMEEAAIPGLGIAVIRNGKTQLMRAYGLADIEQGKPVTIDTPFNLASISKPIMGVAILQIAENGSLDLDADINRYLPFEIDNPKVEAGGISVRHLATHTSGLADFYDIQTYTRNVDSSVSLREHLERLLVASSRNYEDGKYYLPNAPGSFREYSNLGAGVAGLVVESVSGESLSDYSRREIFRPLGMNNTGWLLSEFNLEEVAVPYEVEQCIPYTGICADWKSPRLNALITEAFNPPISYKRYERHPHYGNPQYPDGGVRASIKDLNTFVLEILGEREGQRVFSAGLIDEMLAKQLPDDIGERQRFFWRDDRNGRIGHMGADIGVFTSLYFDPVNRDAVIIVMNRGVDLAAGQAMKKLSNRLWSIY